MGNPDQNTIDFAKFNQPKHNMKSTTFGYLIAIITSIVVLIAAYKLGNASGQNKGYLDGSKTVQPIKDTIFRKQPNDTAKTAILYVDRQSQTITGCVALKVSIDSFYYDSVSPKVFTKRPKRESFYFIPVYVAVKDSTGKVIVDKQGKPVPFIQYQPLDMTLFLQDYNKRF